MPEMPGAFALYPQAAPSAMTAERAVFGLQVFFIYGKQLSRKLFPLFLFGCLTGAKAFKTKPDKQNKAAPPRRNIRS
jgi:hypothetical protein